MEKKTVSDAIRMNLSDPDTIVAAGELVNMRFMQGSSLSLRAAKLFCLLIQEAGIEVTEDKQHSVPYSIINETFHKSRDELVSAIEELHSTSISVRVVEDGRKPYTKSGPILCDVEREDEDAIGAEIRFEFSPTLRRVIANSTHWAAVSRKAVLAFESKYSLRLYLFLSLRAGLRKTSETFTIDDLRDVFGIAPDKLTRWADLRRFAIEPAIAEINHLAGFSSTYEPIKRGRRVNAVKLNWGIKAHDQRIEALKELERSRTGRTARRQENTETIAEQRRAISEALASMTQPHLNPVSN
ncbi:replication initiation protein [Donghicola mangrovi]|uniref:Replication initiation protein n=1 Tax=Donghicola mangrovi TaxID=2729614 RepID=A0A850Q7G3_9RHOB|nr:replication initiation protein [Donghicola mangrovi]NVO25747.1 replication initiation protein [Donghicola mangrovi]